MDTSKLKFVMDRDASGKPTGKPVTFFHDAVTKKAPRGMLFVDPSSNPERTYERIQRAAPNQTVFGKDKNGNETNVEVETLIRYLDTEGNIRSVPMRKDFGRMREDEAGDSVDFNIVDKKWTYATVKDHFDHRERAAHNKAEQDANRKARDPARSEERLADAIVAANARVANAQAKQQKAVP